MCSSVYDKGCSHVCTDHIVEWHTNYWMLPQLTFELMIIFLHSCHHKHLLVTIQIRKPLVKLAWPYVAIKSYKSGWLYASKWKWFMCCHGDYHYSAINPTPILPIYDNYGEQTDQWDVGVQTALDVFPLKLHSTSSKPQWEELGGQEFSRTPSWWGEEGAGSQGSGKKGLGQVRGVARG